MTGGEGEPQQAHDDLEQGQEQYNTTNSEQGTRKNKLRDISIDDDNDDYEDDEDELSRSSNASSFYHDLQELQPPVSPSERARDALLRTLDHPSVQIFGLLVLFAVIADGALFFFLLMGWDTLCRSPMEESLSSSKGHCPLSNHVYNISIHILTGLFTYMATVSMPWRCVNALHTFGWAHPRRSNEIGKDLYGQDTNDVWFHISLRDRRGILLCLILNALTQYANQIARIYYRSYASSSHMPGQLWTTLFFVLSMIFAGISAVWLGITSYRLQRDREDQFGPSPITTAWRWIQQQQDKLQTRRKQQKSNRSSDSTTMATSEAGSPSSARGLSTDEENKQQTQNEVVADMDMEQGPESVTIMIPDAEKDDGDDLTDQTWIGSLHHHHHHRRRHDHASMSDLPQTPPSTPQHLSSQDPLASAQPSATIRSSTLEAADDGVQRAPQEAAADPNNDVQQSQLLRERLSLHLQRLHHHVRRHIDPTRDGLMRQVTSASRGAMRLFGL